MSNLLFLIGNGFDINCGINSRYKDAYKYYLRQTTNDSEAIKKFKKDLLDNHENWSDFEIGISNYAKKLSNENELIECIRDFRKSLKEYLNIEEQNFYDRINSIPDLLSLINKETFKSINTFYAGISNNVSRLVQNIDTANFITFNYTSILDNFIFNRYQNTREPVKLISNRTSSNVLHIHGSFNNGTPVLGIDRIEQIDVPYDLSNKGKRTIIKPTFNSSVDDNRIESAEEFIEQARYICIFGLSLGLSDLTWRELIISWLSEFDTRQLFIYDYSAYNKTELEDDERLDLEDDLKMKLFSDWGLDIASNFWQQIHMPCGNKIFNYKEVIDNFINAKTLEK